jgi:hypothetical protein
MQDNIEVIDTVEECLTDRCSDCTGFYVNKLFQHHLKCIHGCHRLKNTMLGQVDPQIPNINQHALYSLNPINKECYAKHRLVEDENKCLDVDSIMSHSA